MGYNGFGLQRWIFNQRARRPFSKDRKLVGEMGDYHHENDYRDSILRGKAKRIELTADDSRRAALRLQHESKKRNSLYRINKTIVATLILTGVVLIIISYVNSQKPKERKSAATKEMAHACCIKGDKYFERGNYSMAFTKYRDALTYDPNSFEAYR